MSGLFFGLRRARRRRVVRFTRQCYMFAVALAENELDQRAAECFAWLTCEYGDVRSLEQVAKVREELSEVSEEVCKASREAGPLADELGDLLIATLNLCSLMERTTHLTASQLLRRRMINVLARKGPLSRAKTT